MPESARPLPLPVQRSGIKPKFPSQILLYSVAVVCMGVGYLAGVLHWSVGEKAKPARLVDIADRATPLKAGPWGNLESIPLYIEPSEEFLPIKSVEESSQLWKFDGYTPELVDSLFNLADLTTPQKAELLDHTKWTVTRDRIIINPSAKLLLSLDPHARKLIYSVLANIPGNSVRDNRAYFPADKFDEYFADSGLSPEIVDTVKKMCFTHGRLLFFCDAPLILQKLTDYKDKVRFMKVLERKSTLLLRLHVTPDSDVNALVNYYSKAAWGKDIKPILESLAKVPGGARIGMGQLMPPMPTESLYTFPFPSSKPGDQNKDCHWTAFNFFRDPPDQRFTDIQFVKQTLANDYYPVPSDLRYGDIVQLMRPDGTVIHSAVYVADDILYTKNSAQATEPFMLVHMSDMIDTFSSLIPENETLQVLAYRSKYY